MTLSLELLRVQDIFLLALCMWREARGTSDPEIQLVGCSIRNRVKASPARTYAGIILSPAQYSSFNASDPQSSKIPSPTDPQWQKCLLFAKGIYDDVIVDGTSCATNYYDKSMWSNPPWWAKYYDVTIQTVNFRFCRQKSGAAGQPSTIKPPG